MPEAGVEQVQHRVLDAADIEVHAAGMRGAVFFGRDHPVLLGFGADVAGFIRRVEVTQVVPATAGPVGHGVELAGVFDAVEGDAFPVVAGSAQRRCGRRVGVVAAGGLEVLHLRQLDGKVFGVHGADLAVGAVQDGEGLAPVALAAEQPVAQAVVGGGLAQALVVEPGGDGGLGVGDIEAVEADVVVGAVDQGAAAGEGLGLDVVVGGALHDFGDVEVEGFGEGVVARVVRGHGHDGAGAVAHHHVVGDPHGDGLAVDGVDGVGAGEDAGFFFAVVAAVDARFFGGLLAVGVDGRALVGGGEVFDQRVLGGEHHVGGAEERVGAGGEDADVQVRVWNWEVHPGPGAAADPVALQQLDRFGPLHVVQVVDQPVGVGGDAQHPLLEAALDHGVVAAFAAALVGDFFVGQHGAQARAPVDLDVGEVGQAVLVEQAQLLVGGELVPLA